MERIIYSAMSYKIIQCSKESIRDIAVFVVKENYKHHLGIIPQADIENDIRKIYHEEYLYSDRAKVFVVRKEEDIIGSIRVFKWDRKTELPMQKLFGIDPLVVIHSGREYNYWHIGRFAINSLVGIPTITLFKQLMVYAIRPIVTDSKSYMIAETDKKLLKIVNALGIETIQLGKSLDYLASETIPICASKKGLMAFYKRNKGLCNTF